MIEETNRGHFDPVTLEGKVTRFVARDELLERFVELDGHPAINAPVHEAAETIILRDKVNGRRVLKDYEDTPATERYREGQSSQD